MNKERRKVLNNIIDRIEELRSRLENFEQTVNDFNSELEDVQQDINDELESEQETFDNMPEGLQDSERGYAAQTAIENMESAMDGLRELHDKLEELTHVSGDLEGIMTTLDDARGQ